MITNITTNTYIQKSGPALANSRDKESCPNESAKNYVTKTANKNRIKREPAEINFCGLFRPDKMEKFYKSPKLHKILGYADKQQLVFSAGFSLILTCIMRPAAIVLLPSQKKNKQDQLFASAHSIASGVIGFVISSIIFTPFSNAAKAIKKNPTEYIKKDSYLLKNEAAKKTGLIYINRLPDIVSSIPKGILTVALIPPILKYCFGIEKKKNGEAKKLVTPDYSLLNFKSKEKHNDIAFKNIMEVTK